ncbi:GreA/GreB family elongation factor [Haliangium ochraceum]|uniref:GreA/GreB family elongation factor n=1 Tax=Haliangium ochraceum (strain DSM 14365 / JCM 11303 / SMP-2) TaxID=502025 RepID=D0LXK3_HALO1|nr:GreA/GreB family elongation factor [Haliangium ochraceum]ACY17758.1 GreA/GreB family elongation factor [Haliangium ochraceum DSM 14365]
MNKAWLCDQLRAEIHKSAHVARSAARDAAQEAKHGASSNEKRQDARVHQEYSNLARAQHGRAEKAARELDALDAFEAKAYSSKRPIGLGALVEVEDERGEGRTLFLAPVGAGVTLTGPGGDGFLSVVTPASPIGRALLGRRLGEIVDVTVRGEPKEWTITYVE